MSHFTNTAHVGGSVEWRFLHDDDTDEIIRRWWRVRCEPCDWAGEWVDNRKGPAGLVRAQEVVLDTHIAGHDL